MILGAIAVIFLLMGLLQPHTSVNFSDIHEGMLNVQKRVWSIAKDPMSRNSDFSSSSSDPSLSVYEDAINPEEETRIKKPIIVEETWKESGLLNIANFRWIMNNESICKPDPNAPTDSKILPVLIHTNRDHFSERKAIRKSWGSIPIYKKWDVRLIFLLGEPDREKTAKEIAELEEPIDDEQVDSPDYNVSEDELEQEQNKLHEEQHVFGDLVIGSFRDNFNNLTYKHMMGYKWILNYCPQATFIMKVDEDKFVDIIQWLDWRSRDLEDFEKKQAINEVDVVDDDLEESSFKLPDLYCNVFVGGMPERQVGTTYYASPEDWPEPRYPDYCSSWAYGTTLDLIKMQYSVSQERKLFWIDDVFLGALLELVNVKYDWKPKVDDCFKTHMGKEEKFRNVCGSDGKINFEEKREFGAVVPLNRGDGFERDMMCLWNKTVHDIGYKFDA